MSAAKASSTEGRRRRRCRVLDPQADGVAPTLLAQCVTQSLSCAHRELRAGRGATSWSATSQCSVSMSSAAKTLGGSSRTTAQAKIVGIRGGFELGVPPEARERPRQTARRVATQPGQPFGVEEVDGVEDDPRPAASQRRIGVARPRRQRGAEEDQRSHPCAGEDVGPPRAFHSVSARPSPLRVVVKPPVTSKCHGTPSAARATSEIVSPTPRRRTLRPSMTNPASLKSSVASTWAALPSRRARSMTAASSATGRRRGGAFFGAAFDRARVAPSAATRARAMAT